MRGIKGNEQSKCAPMRRFQQFLDAQTKKDNRKFGMPFDSQIMCLCMLLTSILAGVENGQTQKITRNSDFRHRFYSIFFIYIYIFIDIEKVREKRI